jgi:hypothetical protein
MMQTADFYPVPMMARLRSGHSRGENVSRLRLRARNACGLSSGFTRLPMPGETASTIAQSQLHMLIQAAGMSCS